MLPASDLAEIIASLTALNLGPDTTAAVLGAVVGPLLRISGAPGSLRDPDPSERPRRRRHKRAGRPKARGAPRRKYKRRAPRPSEARERARAALEANPGATVSAIAKAAGVSRATVVAAAAERRRPGSKPKPARERAQQFLKDTLASGPKRVSDVEEAAAKAHVDVQALEQARADLGVVTSRADSGAHAVQWSLPG